MAKNIVNILFAEEAGVRIFAVCLAVLKAVWLGLNTYVAQATAVALWRRLGI